MGDLILIKHAPPEITPGVSSHRWVLSEEGRRRCEWVADLCRSSRVKRLFSSLEPKALETAARAATAMDVPVIPLEGLEENDRSGLGFSAPEALEARIAGFFSAAEAVVLGRESASMVRARFETAIARAIESAGQETVAVVSHGTAISAFVAAHNALDPMALWRSLTLPGAVRLNPETFQLLGEPLRYPAPAPNS